MTAKLYIKENFTEALCHRTYDDLGPSVGIAIYDDRVEIENPGSFPPHITAETIKQPHDSHPRNPLIANVLYLSTYLEKWGSGVSRIMEACKQQGVPEPTYEDRGGFIHIVFKRKSASHANDAKNDTKKSVVNGISNRQKRILSIVSGNDKISTEKLSTMLSVSKSTILRDIKDLNTQGILSWIGSKKGGHWEIKE